MIMATIYLNHGWTTQEIILMRGLSPSLNTVWLAADWWQGQLQIFSTTTHIFSMKTFHKLDRYFVASDKIFIFPIVSYQWMFCCYSHFTNVSYSISKEFLIPEFEQWLHRLSSGQQGEVSSALWQLPAAGVHHAEHSQQSQIWAKIRTR